MQTAVTVVPDANGMAVRQSQNNPEYGFIVLKQSRTLIQTNPNNQKSVGWVKVTNNTALIKGKVEELQALNLAPEQTLPGKIVVKESLSPFSEEYPDQHLKVAGDTGIVCCIDGQPIYRMAFYTLDENEQDVFIAHDNGDAIRDANTPAENQVEESSEEEVTEETVEDTVEDTVEEEVEEVEEDEFSFEM